MREIKFRAWDGSSFYDPIISDGKVYSSFRDLEDGIGCNDPVMQYAGLKDKKGVDIFEGDIVEWVSSHRGAEKSKRTDTIEWCDTHACYFLIPFIHEPYAAEMEVIGNIYQNPELMEPRE